MTKQNGMGRKSTIKCIVKYELGCTPDDMVFGTSLNLKCHYFEDNSEILTTPFAQDSKRMSALFFELIQKTNKSYTYQGIFIHANISLLEMTV